MQQMLRLYLSIFGTLGVLGLVLIFLNAPTSDDNLESKIGERWFLPKYGPLDWYSEAGEREPRGRLPRDGKFLIQRSIGDEFEVTFVAPDGSSRTGFVAATDGFVTKINRVLTFTGEMQVEDRIPLSFWFSGGSITDLLEKGVGQNVHPDLEEILKTKWASQETALPILDTKTLMTKSTQQKVRIIKTLLRLPSPARLAELALPVREDDKIVFVVDVSASMQPMGRQVVLATIERLSAKDPKWRTTKRIGSILFRGGSDKMIPHPFKPFDEALDILRTSSFEGIVPAKPLIDAIHFGLMNLRGRQNAQDLIVAFTSAEVYPAGRGTPPISRIMG